VIVAPQFIDKVSALVIANSMIYYAAAIFDLVVGIILSYIGYIR